MSEIEVAVVDTRPIYTDKGSGADHDVAIYEPIWPEGNWFFLGHIAKAMPKSWHVTDSEVSGRAPAALLVAPAGDASVLAPPTGYTRLWTDQGSGGDQNIEMLQPTAPQGYTAVGLFASIVERFGDEPTASSWDRLQTIRVDLLSVSASLGELIWSDKGSGADGKGTWRDISLWSSAPQTAGVVLPSATFVASEGYPASPPQPDDSEPPGRALPTRLTD